MRSTGQTRSPSRKGNGASKATWVHGYMGTRFPARLARGACPVPHPGCSLFPRLHPPQPAPRPAICDRQSVGFLSPFRTFRLLLCTQKLATSFTSDESRARRQDCDSTRHPPIHPPPSTTNARSQDGTPPKCPARCGDCRGTQMLIGEFCSLRRPRTPCASFASRSSCSTSRSESLVTD